MRTGPSHASGPAGQSGADLARVYQALLNAHDHLGMGIVLTEELRALPSFLERVAQVILSGVSAAASRSLVTLGVDMKPIHTTRDVEQGIEIARGILDELSLERRR
ncbi:MAG: hypothetical protein HY678_06400 [Chloroflexi bacterium]|nr:hypothetical protein [Chloroflexota bacterium]